MDGGGGICWATGAELGQRGLGGGFQQFVRDVRELRAEFDEHRFDAGELSDHFFEISFNIGKSWRISASVG